MSKVIQTVGFGLPPRNVNFHRFEIVITDEHVEIIEYLHGYEGMSRVRLPIESWEGPALEHYLNARLNSKGLEGSRFKPGINYVDRFLGREICILAWGLEVANNDPQGAMGIWMAWQSYTIEEKWFMYSQVLRSGYGDRDSEWIGWRRAIHDVLSS